MSTRIVPSRRAMDRDPLSSERPLGRPRRRNGRIDRLVSSWIESRSERVGPDPNGSAAGLDGPRHPGRKPESTLIRIRRRRRRVLPAALIFGLFPLVLLPFLFVEDPP